MFTDKWDRYQLSPTKMVTVEEARTNSTMQEMLGDIEKISSARHKELKLMQVLGRNLTGIWQGLNDKSEPLLSTMEPEHLGFVDTTHALNIRGEDGEVTTISLRVEPDGEDVYYSGTARLTIGSAMMMIVSTNFDNHTYYIPHPDDPTKMTEIPEHFAAGWVKDSLTAALDPKS